MGRLQRYPVRPDVAQRYMEQAASAEEIARLERWCARRGQDPRAEPGVVRVVSSQLWGTQRWIMPAVAGAPTVSSAPFTYAVGQPLVAGGANSTLRETNMEQAGMIPTTTRFLVEAWGIMARVSSPGTPVAAAETVTAGLLTQLLRALAVRVTQGQTYRVDLGPVEQALLTQAAPLGTIDTATPATAVQAVAQYSRALPLPEPWDLQPGVQFQAELLGDTGFLNTITAAGVALDVTVVLRGTRRDVVAG